MGKERFVVRKRDIVLSAAIAVTLSFGVKAAQAEVPSQPEDYSTFDFKPIIVDNELNKDSVDIGDRLTVIFPSPSVTALSEPTLESTKKPNPPAKVSQSNWTLDSEISWYGPGFYGKRTACGLELTKDLEGVANRDLPCGTLVTFEWKGIEVTVPVVDRGPYVNGRIFDLTGGACMAFATPEFPKGHCFTGPIYYKIEK